MECEKHIQPAGSTSFNQGIVMRRSAREMDSGAPAKNMSFFPC